MIVLNLVVEGVPGNFGMVDILPSGVLVMLRRCWLGEQVVGALLVVSLLKALNHVSDKLVLS